MELINEIKEIVKEELGISKSVVEHTNNIFKEIIVSSKNNSTKEKQNVKIGTFSYEIENKTINVIYKIVYLEKLSDFDMGEFMGSSYMLNKNNFVLKTTVVFDRSKNKYIDFDGTLQHEIEHIFQQLKSKNSFLAKQSTADLYATAVDLAKNGETNLCRIVGYAVYYNTKFERDAYINDLYKTIMDNNIDNPYNIIKHNLAYKNICAIKQAVIENNNKEEIEPIVKKYFNKTYGWFYRLTQNMIKEYMRKIGKLMVKVTKDIEEENKKNFATDGGRFPIKAEPPLSEQ